MTKSIYPEISTRLLSPNRMNHDSSTRPRNKHLAPLLTSIGLLPLVYFIPPWIAENITSDNRIVTLIAVAAIVPIISYIFLPMCFWIIAKAQADR